MRTLILSLTVIVCFSVFAESKTTSTKRSPGSEEFQCERDALDAIAYIDKIGWGSGKTTKITVISKKMDNVERSEEFRVRSSVSQYVYKITFHNTFNSDSCVVIEVSSK